MKIIDYIIDDNGNPKQVSREVEIKEIKKPDTESHNNVRIVEINGVIGFLKESGDSMPTFDKFEYLISKIGFMLGIKTADEYLVYDDNKVFLFSKSVINDNEKLIMMSDLNEEIVRKLGIPEEVIIRLMSGENFNILAKEYNLSYEIIKEFNDLFAEVSQIKDDKNDLEVIVSTPGSEKYRVDDHYIEYAIDIFINRLKKLHLSNEERIIEDYIKMCFFDALIGNKDRNVYNYGLIKHENNIYSFAPLFDSSTIAMPNIDNDLWQLNEYNMNRLATLKLLLDKYSNYLENIFERDIDKIGNIMTSISKEILDSNSKKFNEFEWFNDSVLNKLNTDTFENKIRYNN